MSNLEELHLSFEFFPAKSAEAEAELIVTAKSLASYEPDLFTVTYGAGGSTRAQTMETVLSIRDNLNTPIAAHISGIGATRIEILDLLKRYQAADIKHLVVLRGDTPSGMHTIGDFIYASDLVSFIREMTSDFFHITVAAYPEMHPQSDNPIRDLAHFAHKVRSGANQAYTQYFFNPDAYFYFVDTCALEGIDIPIIPGIMPITNYKQLARFSDMCGAEIPRWIKQRLAYFEAKEDKESILAFGIEVISMLCETLLENGAPGIHFYTMNRQEPIQSILRNLGF